MQYIYSARKQHGFQKTDDYSPYQPYNPSLSSDAALPSGSTAKTGGGHQHLQLGAVPPKSGLAAVGRHSSDSSEFDTIAKAPHPAFSSVSTGGGGSQDCTSKYLYSAEDLGVVPQTSKAGWQSGGYRTNPAPPRPNRYTPRGQVGNDGATGASPFVRSPGYGGGIAPPSLTDYDDGTISSTETLVTPVVKSGRQSAVTFVDNCQTMSGYISSQVSFMLWPMC